MAAKLEEVRRLLDEGYTLEEVESEKGYVEARFRRGMRCVSVRFRPHEAEALLLAGPLRLRA